MLEYEYQLKLKDCDKVFSEGFAPGVVVKMIATFEDAFEEDKNEPMFLKALMDAETDFINDYIEVIIEPHNKAITAELESSADSDSRGQDTVNLIKQNKPVFQSAE